MNKYLDKIAASITIRLNKIPEADIKKRNRAATIKGGGIGAILGGAAGAMTGSSKGKIGTALGALAGAGSGALALGAYARKKTDSHIRNHNKIVDYLDRAALDKVTKDAGNSLNKAAAIVQDIKKLDKDAKKDNKVLAKHTKNDEGNEKKYTRELRGLKNEVKSLVKEEKKEHKKEANVYLEKIKDRIKI